MKSARALICALHCKIPFGLALDGLANPSRAGQLSKGEPQGIAQGCGKGTQTWFAVSKDKRRLALQ